MTAALCEGDVRYQNGAESVVGNGHLAASLATFLQNITEFRLIMAVWACEAHRCVFRAMAESQSCWLEWHRAEGFVALQIGRTGKVNFIHQALSHRPIKETERVLRWDSGRRPGDHPNLVVLGM